MATPHHSFASGSGIDLALERALDAANLRAGDAATHWVLAAAPEPTAAESGDAIGGIDAE